MEKYGNDKHCLSTLKCNKGFCEKCVFNEKLKVLEHLRDDIKESKKSIKEDKELERTLGRMI